MTADRPRVMIAVPNAGSIHPSVVHRVIQMMLDTRYDVMYYPCRPMRPMDRSRKAVLEYFLATDAAYLVMIDSDNPPMANVLDLVQCDLPVVGCPTPYYEYRSDEMPPIRWNTWDYTDDGNCKPIPPDKRNGLMQVDFVGLGCVVIRRDVIMTLGVGALADSRDGHGVSRDNDDDKFRERCAEVGIPIHVHWDYTCRHMRGDVDLYDVLQCWETCAGDVMRDTPVNAPMPLDVSQTLSGIAPSGKGDYT